MKKNNLSSRIYHLGSNKAFTFIELIVTMTLIALLAVVTIGFINPLKQIQRSWDGKRKGELTTLSRVFEDFYNDKNHFPLPADVCFDTPSSPRIDTYGKTACYCQICGNKNGSPTFSPYVPQLPCDPQSPQKEYLYDYDCSTASPHWFRVYTKLSVTDNQDIKRVGCRAGCGPAPDFAYNYAVFSNTEPETISCTGKDRFYQKDSQGNCNICKSPSGGDICNYNNDIYYEVTCTKKCSP